MPLPLFLPAKLYMCIRTEKLSSEICKHNGCLAHCAPRGKFPHRPITLRGVKTKRWVQEGERTKHTRPPTSGENNSCMCHSIYFPNSCLRNPTLPPSRAQLGTPCSLQVGPSDALTYPESPYSNGKNVRRCLDIDAPEWQAI